MNNRALTLSLLMAVIAVFFVQSYVSNIEESAKKKFGTEILVLSAKRDIKEMETLDETMMELKKLPKRFLEPAAISFLKEDDKGVTRDIKLLSGAVAMVPIKKGEQITYNKITEPNLKTGLAPQVTPGRRAVSIPVNEVTGVSKLVKPGDRVDLIAVIDMGQGKNNRVAKTVLQDAVVLAVGRYVTNNVPRLLEKDPFGGAEKVKSLTQYDGFVSVTLEVEPPQAQMLALILAEGSNTMSLSLRNNDDSDRTPINGMAIGDILGQDVGRSRAPAGEVKK